MFGAPAKLNMPHLHNLIADPKELYPIDKVNVSASWVFPVVLKKESREILGQITKRRYMAGTLHLSL